jgi:hypothetical protein
MKAVVASFSLSPPEPAVNNLRCCGMSALPQSRGRAGRGFGGSVDNCTGRPTRRGTVTTHAGPRPCICWTRRCRSSDARHASIASGGQQEAAVRSVRLQPHNRESQRRDILTPRPSKLPPSRSARTTKRQRSQHNLRAVHGIVAKSTGSVGNRAQRSIASARCTRPGTRCWPPTKDRGEGNAQTTDHRCRIGASGPRVRCGNRAR